MTGLVKSPAFLHTLNNMDPAFSHNGHHYPTPSFKEVHTLNAKTKRYMTVLFSQELTPTVQDWRCHSCGSIVFQYYNAPKAVFDGAINIADCIHPTDHLCKKCNIIFRITVATKL